MSGSTKQKILREIRSDPDSIDQQKLLLTKRKDLHNIQSAINKRAVATEFDCTTKKRKTDYGVNNVTSLKDDTFHNKNNITVRLPIDPIVLMSRSQALSEDVRSSVMENQLGNLAVIAEQQESSSKQSKVSVSCHSQPLPMELIVESVG